MGEAVGISAADQRGLQAGTYNGTLELGQAGALYANSNTSVNFNASGDYLNIPHRSEYNLNAFTIELWVRLNSYGNTATYRRIASKGAGAGERNWLMALGSGANGEVVYGFGDGTTNHGRRSNLQLQLNQWHLLHFVHKAGDRTQLYIDGQFDSEQVVSATPVTSTAPIRLASNGSDEFTNARYDELAIYNRDLTADEIRQHYHAGAPPASVCTRFASTTGSDSGSGSASSPFRTAGRLAGSLTSGQVGCLRAGTYSTESNVTVSNPGVILRSHPGERATLVGGIVINGAGVKLENLSLNGKCAAPPCLPSPIITAADVAIRDSDITNEHSGICVHPDAFGGLVPHRFLIERNRIHNCGQLPAANHHHGIYVTAGSGGVIRDNAIFDNADRGVQLYPDAQGVSAYNNTVDGNGQGIIISDTSANNVFDDNIITNSKVRWNVEWDSLTGAGNVVRDTCLHATNTDPAYNVDGGVKDYERDRLTLTNNQVANPLYLNRASKDFRLATNSQCLGRGAPASVAAP